MRAIASIGMTEVIAIRRHAIGLAVEELQELGAHIVLAGVMRHFERIEPQAFDAALPQQLAHALRQHGRMGVGPEQGARATEFGKHAMLEPFGAAASLSNGASASLSTSVDVDGVPRRKLE